MSQVFLSYSSDDADVAGSVARAIREGGVSVWMAPDSIQPGEVYNEAIVAGLRGSDALAVLVSNAANTSRHVAREVALADDLRKTIFPIRIEPVQPSDGLRYYLSLPQWIEWHKDRELALRPLLAALNVSPRADADPPVRPSVARGPVARAPVSDAENLPVLEVRRLSVLELEHEFMDILVDGEARLKLRNGETGRVSLQQGAHTVTARIARLESQPEQLQEWHGEAVVQVLFGLRGPVLSRLR